VTKIPKVLFALCCTSVFIALAVEPSATLFENDQVKVVRALEKAHVKGSFHEHKLNRVMVYLQPGTQRFEYQDGRQPASFNWKAGQVVWSKSEGMHSPEVTTDDPFNIIELEIKNPAGTPKPFVIAHDALHLDARNYKLEFGNDQVRVLRLKLEPHRATPMIEHSLNSVVIFLTDQQVHTTDKAGKVNTATHKAGEAVWQTPATEKIENTGDAPLEMVLVELRS
jgi:hypothetical protein